MATLRMSPPTRSAYVRLAGGLGNQLFQLAAALVCARRAGLRVVPVIEGLATYEQVREATSLRLLASGDFLNARVLPGAVAWAVGRARVGRIPGVGVNDGNFAQFFRERPAKKRFLVLDGYFQRGWTQELFAEALLMMRMHHVVPVLDARYDCIIHVRGTDFIGLKTHGFLQPDYYINAVTQAMNKGLHRFGVVTDDQVHGANLVARIGEVHPDIALSLLPAAADPLHDFHIIRTAPARIMGNSTFAWWAAALHTEATPTWSCVQFVRHQIRDFFLESEILLDARGLPYSRQV